MIINIKITRAENARFFNVKINEIVQVELEDYIATVVASEIGNSNLEACKAQAVAARTYAVARGVLQGKVISDSSSAAQAYRAERLSSKYDNAILGAQLTKGQVLYYKDKIISAVYSDSNGGTTVSAEAQWGNTYPYLIAQPDPWTAATGKEKHGHGVGMSQVGAIWAGAHGIDYKEILNFYYPNTKIQILIERNKILKIRDTLQEIYDLVAQNIGNNS